MPFQNKEVGFESLNISEDGDANAVLLAVSCLIQEGRNAGEVQSLISEISSKFEISGTLPETLIDTILAEKENVSIANVLRNLIAFYESSDMDDFEIPSFYAILDKEYTTGLHIINRYPLHLEEGGYNTGLEGRTDEKYVVSYQNFVVESDVDWIEGEKVEVSSNLYMFKYKVLPNTDEESRSRIGNVYLKSTAGEILHSEKITQKGNEQRIYIINKYLTTRMEPFNEGDMVNINGQDYPLRLDSSVNMYYVELPKQEKGYGISNMPEMIVAGKNGDVLCATLTYKPEVDEFVTTIDQELPFTRMAEMTASISSFESGNVPSYAALKGMEGWGLPNPAKVELESACALLALQFINKDRSNPVTFSKMEIEFAEDGFLSGEVTECMYPDQAMFDPAYRIPKVEYENKSNKLTVYNTNGDNQVSVLAHPQKVSFIKCTAFDEAGNQLFQFSQNFNLELKKGTKLSIRFAE